MPKLIPEPTGRMVSELHQQLIREWTPRIRLDEEFRDLIRGTQIIETLEKDKNRNMEPIEIHSGRAGGIIEHANGLMMTNPSFHVEPTSLGTKDAREAEAIERATANVFEEHLLANDFWPAVGRDVLSYGRAYIKALTLDSEWTVQAGYPPRKEDETASEWMERVDMWKQKEAKFPFVITHISPLDILTMLDGTDNVIASVEEKYITAKVLAEDMKSETVRKLIERGSVKWYDQLPVVEYIDEQWIGYFLTGTETQMRDQEQLRHMYARTGSYEKLQVFEHGMGKHPIVLVSGINTGEPEYYYRWKSFLADGKESLELFDFLLSRLTTMVWAYYLPSYMWQIGATSASFKGKERPKLNVNLGGVTTVYADEVLDVLPAPSQLPDALTLLQQADDMIQRHTLEDVLFGRVTGSAPAFQVNLRIQVARSKLTPIAQHLAGGISRVMELLLRGIQHLGEPVYIGTDKITTTMAKEYQNRITASIIPKSPIDRNQAIGTAGMALEFGLPWDWIVEHILDIEDPATLRLMSDIRQLEQSEELQMILKQDALEHLQSLMEDEDYVPAESVDMSMLPPEFANALGAAQGQAAGEGLAPSGAAPEGAEGGPAAGLGGGPNFPEGASPQAIQGGRGLGTLNAPPSEEQPGATGIASEGAPLQ